MHGEPPCPRTVTRAEFDRAVEAVWTEIEYQNNLPRRTPDEAKEHMAFCALARRYMRKMEDDWADNPGIVPAVHDGTRKLAGIWIRAMIYCGIAPRK